MFCRVPLDVDLSDVFLMGGLWWFFEGKKTTEAKCHFITSCHMLLTFLITNNVKLDYLDEVMFFVFASL